eukprot:Hpha_TRINITY_DN15876_c0_g6::TRINITY_DN15876_c0_g6_i1::g.190959::m.190959
MWGQTQPPPSSQEPVWGAGQLQRPTSPPVLSTAVYPASPPTAPQEPRMQGQPFQPQPQAGLQPQVLPMTMPMQSVMQQQQQPTPLHPQPPPIEATPLQVSIQDTPKPSAVGGSAVASTSFPAASAVRQGSEPKVVKRKRNKEEGVRAVVALMCFCCLVLVAGVAMIIAWQSRGDRHDFPCQGACQADSLAGEWLCVGGDGCCPAADWHEKALEGTCTERAPVLLVLGICCVVAPIITTICIWWVQWCSQYASDNKEAEEMREVPVGPSTPLGPSAHAHLESKVVKLLWQGQGAMCSVALGVDPEDSLAAAKRLLGLPPSARLLFISAKGKPTSLDFFSVEKNAEYTCIADGGAPLAVVCPEVPEAEGLYRAALQSSFGGLPCWTKGEWRLETTTSGSWVLRDGRADGEAKVESAPHQGRPPQELDLPGLWQACSDGENWKPCRFRCRAGFPAWGEELEADLGGQWIRCYVAGHERAAGDRIYYQLVSEGRFIPQSVGHPAESGQPALRPHKLPPLAPTVSPSRIGVTSPRCPTEPRFAVKTVSLAPGRGTEGPSSVFTVAKGVPEEEVLSGMRERLGISGALVLRETGGPPVRASYDGLREGGRYFYHKVEAPPLFRPNDSVEVEDGVGGTQRGVVKAARADGQVVVSMLGGGEKVVTQKMLRAAEVSPHRAVVTPAGGLPPSRGATKEEDGRVMSPLPPPPGSKEGLQDVLSPPPPTHPVFPPAPLPSGGGSARGGGASPGMAAALELRRSLSAQQTAPERAQDTARVANALIRQIPVLSEVASRRDSERAAIATPAPSDKVSIASAGDCESAATPQRPPPRRTRRSSRNSTKPGPSDALSPPQPTPRAAALSDPGLPRAAAPSPSRQLGSEVQNLLAQIQAHSTRRSQSGA